MPMQPADNMEHRRKEGQEVDASVMHLGRNRKIVGDGRRGRRGRKNGSIRIFGDMREVQRVRKLKINK